MLDDIRVADASGFLIEPGLVERSTLPQQIPALVQADLEIAEPPAIFLADGPLRLSLPELVFLGDELLDALVDPTVL